MLSRTHMTHQVETERGSVSATACVYLAGGTQPQAPKFAGRINLDWRSAP